MISGYANSELKRLCTESRFAKRELGEKGAKGLARRVKELEVCDTVGGLLSGTGSWHPVLHDYPGCFSGKVDKGSRLIVEPTVTGFKVIDIGSDVYKH